MASDALQHAQLAAMITAYITALTTPTVGLFKDVTTITPLTNLALLNQPTGSWYTAKTGTYGRVYENQDGSCTVEMGSLQFNYTGTDPSETIVGWLVWGTPLTPVYLSGGILPAPVAMGTTLDSVVVTPSITIPAIPQS